MSHHFDTPTAQRDPRVNVCDFYLFQGRPGSTVMALTVNPDAGRAAPDMFHDEGLYAFRFDLDGDACEEVTFKVRFSPPTHPEGDDHRHVQTYEVRRATGDAATKGADGQVIIAGRTGEVASAAGGVMAFAGVKPDLFAGDGMALGAFRKALFTEDRFAPSAFNNKKNFFAESNVTALVIELPDGMIGKGLVHAWATASLYGHAPEVQVSRWGLPLITNFFMPDPDMKEAFNRTTPAEDMARFSAQIGAVVEKLTTLAGSTTDPKAYATRLLDRLCPVVLPYRLGTPASFELVGFNGRPLGDDVMDIILSLATNTALGDGVAPDPKRIRRDFPYFGDPHRHDPGARQQSQP